LRVWHGEIVARRGLESATRIAAALSIGAARRGITEQGERVKKARQVEEFRKIDHGRGEIRKRGFDKRRGFRAVCATSSTRRIDPETFRRRSRNVPAGAAR